jgi:uncharacterized protein DUF4154
LAGVTSRRGAFSPARQQYGEQAASILESLQGTSVLTVGEADDFTTNGGIVQFKQFNAHIHIETVPETAERAHLRISSKLLMNEWWSPRESNYEAA